MYGSIAYVVIGIVVFLGVMLALRELVCWYLKINERIENQKSTIKVLLSIRDQLAGKVNEADIKKVRSIQSVDLIDSLDGKKIK